MADSVHECPICGGLFVPKRRDAVYCSARCRKRAQRGKVNKAKDETLVWYRQVETAINRLSAYNAHRKLVTLAMRLIEALPDEYRAKLYSSLENDFYRIRDKQRHGYGD